MILDKEGLLAERLERRSWKRRVTGIEEFHTTATQPRWAVEAKNQQDRFEHEAGERQTGESGGEDHEEAWKGLDELLVQIPHDPDGDIPPPDEPRKIPKEPIHPGLNLIHDKITDTKPDRQVSGIEPPIAGHSKENDHLPVTTPNDLRRVEVAPTMYLSGVPLGLQTTSSTESATSIFNTTELKLGDYFKDGKEPPDCFTDM